MKLSPARVLALEVTQAIREREGYAAEILNAALRRANLSDADARFATALTYGVVETAGTLDWIVDRAVSDPSRVEPAVRDVLRIGAYELTFMKKPAHVVVDQTVELMKRSSRRAAGFANAVMRRLAADIAGFPWGDPDTDDEALARASGFPTWLVRRMIVDSDRDATRRFLDAHRAPAPLYLAVNRFRTTDEEALHALEETGAGPSAMDVDGCITVENAARALSSQQVARGEVIVADAAAQFIASTIAASAAAETAVLEVGSGRGTKAALIQSGRLVRDTLGPLYALDSHPFKIDILKTRMKELRVRDVIGVVGDARDLEAVIDLPGAFEVVSIDAPCSGVGTLRRNPDKRWRLTPEAVTSLARLGGELLAAAADSVAPGGTLFYSTCTVLPEENEDVIDTFLASAAGRGFVREPFAVDIPAAFPQSMMSDGYFRSHPVTGGPDGHFATRLVRRATHIEDDPTDVG